MLSMDELFFDVGVKLDEERADGTLGRDGCSALESKREAPVGGGVVDVGDGASDEVAPDVGVGGLPFAVVALGSNR